LEGGEKLFATTDCAMQVCFLLGYFFDDLTKLYLPTMRNLGNMK